MLLFVTILHVFLCFILMLVILLQPGKGSDVGAAFGGGGGSSTIFGPRGAGNLLSRATTVVAVLFMTTSITLAIYSNAQVRTGSDVEDVMRRLQQEEGATQSLRAPGEDQDATAPATEATEPTVEPGPGLLPEGPVPPAEEYVPVDPVPALPAAEPTTPGSGEPAE